MKKLSTMLTMAIILTLIPALVLVVSTPCSAALKIKLGVVTKPGSAQNLVADKFKELLEHRSKNRIRVKVFHSAALGNETEILQQIQMGTIEMGVITAGPFDTFDPIVRVINYPFLFKDNAQADAILDGSLGREIFKSLESSGFKGLCYSENGFRNLTNNRRPVKTPEDINGLKIRVMASSLHKTVWQSLGANPTPMPWPIYTELEQGVIDGQENPLWVMEVYKFYEIQRYLTLTRHVYSTHLDVAGLKWWNGLSEENQTLIQTAMEDAARFQRADNRAKDAARLELLVQKGMQIETEPDIDAFRKKVETLKYMDLYSNPRVNALLVKMLEATN